MKCIFTCLIGLYSLISFGQCNGRYETEIFSDVITSTHTYSTVNNLDLDIYMGDGDTEIDRPLVILAHGGSFISGSKTNPLMVDLATTLAKRGYVVASISYRLISMASLTDPAQYIDGVIKGLGDGRAAIRYFYKSVEDGNQFEIDTNQIYFGGNSAGGVIGLHAAYLDNSDTPGTEFQIALDNNGGIEGNSGNPGYSSKLAGIISMAGGIADINFINEADTNILLVTAHGDNDNVVPFTCASPLGLSTLPDLCGGGSLKTHADGLNYSKNFHSIYTDEAHCPWNNDATHKSSLFDFVTEKLYQNLPCAAEPIGLSDLEKEQIILSPNPVNSILNIEGVDHLQALNLFDSKGVLLTSFKPNNSIDLSNYVTGFYYLQIQSENDLITKKVLKL